MISTTFTVDGDVLSFNKEFFKNSLETLFPDAERIIITVSAGSVIVHVELVMRSAASAQAARTILEDDSPEALANALGWPDPVHVMGEIGLSASATPSEITSSSGTTAVIVSLLLFVLFIAIYLWRRRGLFNGKRAIVEHSIELKEEDPEEAESHLNDEKTQDVDSELTEETEEAARSDDIEEAAPGAAPHVIKQRVSRAIEHNAKRFSAIGPKAEDADGVSLIGEKKKATEMSDEMLARGRRMSLVAEHKSTKL